MSNIMNEYKKLVKFLGLILGENCEIALQDVRDGQKCIVAIENGNISGRKIGSPLTDFAVEILSKGVWKHKDYYYNYTGKTKDNKILRSSTYFIKEQGELIAMLCFNIDDSKYIDLSKMLLNLGGINLNLNDILENHENKSQESETFYGDIDETTDLIITEFFAGRTVVPIDRLKQAEKIDIVRRLDEKGVFMVKGAVSQVAKKLNISEASLYRYLSKITKCNTK